MVCCLCGYGWRSDALRDRDEKRREEKRRPLKLEITHGWEAPIESDMLSDQRNMA